ncbi:FAD:protein FMN transferase [Gemmatimonadota bacterium]
MIRDRTVRYTLLIITSIVVGIALWQTRSERDALRFITLTSEPAGIMGTTCRLAVVARTVEADRAEEALADAESVLRGIELEISSWLNTSLIARFNQAPAGEAIELSEISYDLLRHAQAAHQETHGTFDVTVRPLIMLWRGSVQAQHLPTPEEITRARETSSWDLIDLRPMEIVKISDGAQVDLGGIAKGYAIDRAIDAIQNAGVAGGLIDVGGDLRVFGQPPDGHAWQVDIRDPAGSGIIGRLSIESGAVCTSGDYSRFNEIAGERYSHIIDPRTGRPAEIAISVTVIAPSALLGDIWATSLSVLGPDGITSLPDGLESMMMVQDGRELASVSSAGFPAYQGRNRR